LRYFPQLSYKGTHYCGWQRQANVPSVQATIEDNLSKMLHQTTTIHGCGRTDAGVHAKQYFAHFDWDEKIDFDFIFRINKMLPKDIAIHQLLKIGGRANAQLDANGRTYEYHFHFEKNPFLSEVSTFYQCGHINVAAMQEALPIIQQQKDFRTMCLQPDSHNHTLCEIYDVQLLVDESQKKMLFRITANRFLRSMIRLLAARLLDIGIGKMQVKDLQSCFETGKRPPFHKAALPQGLYLAKVSYPFLD